MRTGGNFDQRRLGKGATLYLPVEVGGEAAQHSWCLLLWRCCGCSCRALLQARAASGSQGCPNLNPPALHAAPQVVGALLSLGDGHGAMGDGEVAGTGLEASLNARLKVTLHKRDSLPALVQVSQQGGRSCLCVLECLLGVCCRQWQGGAPPGRKEA